MNFEFSESQEILRDQAKSFLQDKSVTKKSRSILEGESDPGDDLFDEMVQLGWVGATIPEAYGGSGLGKLELCVLAEEMGRSLLPTAFSTSVYLATEALLLAGSESQKKEYLPRLASGELTGTFAVSESADMPTPDSLKVKCIDGIVTGTKMPVPDGMTADIAIVSCSNGWYLVDLNDEGVVRRELVSLDPGRSQAEIIFHDASAQPLGNPDEGWQLTESLLDRAAVLYSFEQVGGALACLDMAKDYALNRYAFGRSIATYQAIKHKLANMYVAATLARSNCYYGASALDTDSPELPLAAATARVSATDAFDECSEENIQTHGGMGFTWDFDCHLYYRRCRNLAANVGHRFYWEDRLISQLQSR